MRSKETTRSKISYLKLHLLHLQNCVSLKCIFLKLHPRLGETIMRETLCARNTAGLPLVRRLAMSGGIVFAGIAPHPPLLVPEVGGDRLESVAGSRQALRDFSARLVRSGADVIVLISPHSPLDLKAFLARSTAHLSGDFRDFGAPRVALTFENDLVLLDAIKQAAEREGLDVRDIKSFHPLDHGALVPLYYIAEAGWRGPITVLGFTLQSNDKHLGFGRSIRKAAESLHRRVALVASGDLSHRLAIDGPYEYEPTAHLFDEQIVNSIDAQNPAGVLDIDSDLKDRAGECGYRSILIALGAVDDQQPRFKVLSYEGPFGVGYMVADLMNL
jgi:AmmeMemoRadiSam system protein B